jgi:ParB family chromosome partitioning protein
MSKLTDKAKSISFDDDDDLPSPVATPSAKSVGRSDEPTAQRSVERPRTALGAISASIAMGRGVEAENRDLRARLERFEDAKIVELMDPKTITPSRFANRHSLSFEGSQFDALKAEIRSAGRNVQPIKVRRIGQGGDGSVPGAAQYEIAFGHRRHRACLDLGLPVAAIVEELSDLELFGEMERENRERQSLSPWEQGVMYKRAIDEGLFPSIRQLAAAIGAQPGNVSTAIRLASLPDAVVNAFPSPLGLQFRWGAALSAAIDKDGDAVLALARELGSFSPKLEPKDVLARLTGVQAQGSRAAPEVLMRQGQVVGSWGTSAKGDVSVQLSAGCLSSAKVRRLREFIEKLLA